MSAAGRLSKVEETVETKRKATGRPREHHGLRGREAGLDRFRDDSAVVLIMIIEMSVVDTMLYWYSVIVVSFCVPGCLFLLLVNLVPVTEVVNKTCWEFLLKPDHDQIA